MSRTKAKTQEEKLDRSTSCREVIKGPGNFSFDPPIIEDLSRLRQEKTLRARQIVRCREGIEEVLRLLKNYFSKREKHIYECNKACNSTKDPISNLNSQNHLSTTILSTQIPKTHTHTHTLNRSNQLFYISKIS